MSRNRFFLLGSFLIEKDGKHFQDLQSPQILGLLAYLLAERRREHSREELLRMFFAGVPEISARNNLRVALFRLRSAFQRAADDVPFIIGSNRSIRVNPECKPWVDIEMFQMVVERYQDEYLTSGTLSHAAIRELNKALQFYRHEFLHNLEIDNPEFKNWLFFKQEQYRQYASWVNNRLLEFHEGNRKFDHCLQYTRFGLIQDPWDEKLHQQHMRFLTLTGQKAQALKHYQMLQQAFETERGLRLSDETEALHSRIQRYAQGDRPSSLTAKTHFLPDLAGNVTNFPPVSFAFMGREEEINTISQWLADPHRPIITLMGPGGVGKTQLAIQSATQNREQFPDGVYYIPLEAPTTSRLFASNLAHIIGLETSGHKATQSQVLEALQNQRVLLVLDNVRQLNSLDFFLHNLIERAPLVKLLITARGRLNFEEESLFEVKGLGYPPESAEISFEEALQYPAVKLFDQFAQKHNIYTNNHEDEVHDILRICRLLDGHPLGIELAASWTAVDNCAQVVESIERGLVELADQHGELSQSQAALRVVCDLSWNLLNTQEQIIFEKLAIFPGGFKREIAHLVTNASQHDLLILKQHSFIDRSQKTGRYYVHPLLKEYASQRRMEANQTDPSAEDAFRKAYCDFYLYFLYKRYLNLLNESNHSHVYEILYELPNLRQAWEESLYHGVYDHICRAAPALTAFYRRQGLIGEGMMELEPLITTLRVMLQDENVKNTPKIYFTLSFLLIEKSNFLIAQNSLEQAKRVTEQALEYALSASDVLGHMRCLYQLAEIYNRSNNQERALSQVEKALELIQTETFEFDAQIVQVWVAWCFELCAEIYTHLERYQDAVKKLERAVFLYKNSDQVMQTRLCEQKVKALQEIQAAIAQS